MEALSWILLLISVILSIILLNILCRKSKDDKEYFEIIITYLDGKTEIFKEVEDYEIEASDDFLSIDFKSEESIYIKINEVKKFHIK